METTLYYFSGTGNSLATARALADQLGDCAVEPLVKAMRQKKFAVNSPKVGLVFPLYYVGMPKIVQEFVQRLELNRASYIFIVVTKGWPVVGGAINQTKQMMEKMGARLDAGMYIQLPMNDITMVTVASPRTQKRLLAKAPRRITAIAAIVAAARKHYDLELGGFLWPTRNLPFIERVNEEDRLFEVKGHCSGCGRCAQVCPVNNIRIENAVPQWSGKCQQCLACYHFCPHQAIRFNRRGDGIQYHHPDIKLADLMQQK